MMYNKGNQLIKKENSDWFLRFPTDFLKGSPVKYLLDCAVYKGIIFRLISVFSDWFLERFSCNQWYNPIENL
jgi:DNA relaxase NicK